MKTAPIGQYLRHLREKSGELLKDMAQKLGISISQLSAIELGKRTISNEIEEKIIKLYDKNNDEQHIRELIKISQPSHKEDFGNVSIYHRELFHSFAKEYKELSEEEAQEFLRLFYKEINKNKGKRDTHVQSEKK